MSDQIRIDVDELKEAAMPLMEFMRKFHPHVTCIANSEHVEFLEGQATAMRVSLTQFMQEEKEVQK